MYKIVVLALSLLFSVSGIAAESSLTGTLSNITSIKEGLLITLDSGLPDNCKVYPSGWMLVSQQDKAMMALVLTSWITGNRVGTVYTGSGVTSYCTVNQWDPS